LHTDIGAVNNQAVACGDRLRERKTFNRVESDCPVSDTFAVCCLSVFREGDVNTCSGRTLAERIAILPDVVSAFGNVIRGDFVGIGLDVVEFLFAVFRNNTAVACNVRAETYCVTFIGIGLDFFSAIKISPCPLSKKFSNEFASRS